MSKLNAILFCSLITSLTLLSCRRDEKINLYETEVIFKDLSYGSSANQVMDVYLPANRGDRTPGVIYIHGGGWNGGGKEWFENDAPILMSAGISVASINYRYADSINGIGYLEILSDLNNAINFLQQNSSSYGCPFNKLTLFGSSSGAHLSMLYAYKFQNQSIKNVIAISGFSDLTDTVLYSNSYVNSIIRNLMGGELDSLKLKDASPVNYNSSITTFFYHGIYDNVVPYSQSIKIFDKLKIINPNCKLTLFESGHLLNSTINNQIIYETINWINK